MRTKPYISLVCYTIEVQLKISCGDDFWILHLSPKVSFGSWCRFAGISVCPILNFNISYQNLNKLTIQHSAFSMG